MKFLEILEEEKNKIIKIIDSFEDYYCQNSLTWDIKELTLSHQILGTLIMTFKKTEYMIQSINYFEEIDLMDIFEIEVKEVKIITEYYYETFVIKKGA